MKTTFDTTWYVESTRVAAEAALRSENDRWFAEHAVGYLYVAEFTSGVVKVGKAAAPKDRIAAHDRVARVHGGAVRASWTSRQLVAYAKAERDLIRLCTQQGAPVMGREYFDIGFKVARGLATLVDKNSFDASDLPSSALALLGGAA